MHKYKSISFENPVSTQPSMHKQSDQEIKDFVIRLIAHRKIHPCLFIHDAALMREFRKSGLTVIAAHTAFSYTAKRHLTGSKMNQCVVDAATAKQYRASGLGR